MVCTYYVYPILVSPTSSCSNYIFGVTLFLYMITRVCNLVMVVQLVDFLIQHDIYSLGIPNSIATHHCYYCIIIMIPDSSYFGLLPVRNTTPLKSALYTSALLSILMIYMTLFLFIFKSTLYSVFIHWHSTIAGRRIMSPESCYINS